ncbi:MAG: ABC-type dipeptide/oligopeptide/nickel transport system, permease component, partial [halophilic archaeon J07HX5]
MSLFSVLARRFAAGLVTVWATLSALFALFYFTDDWNLDRILASLRRSPGGQEQQFREQYLAGRGRPDGGFVTQYGEFLVDMFSLQWQESYATGESVLSLTISAALRTGAYVLPATVLAIVLALSVGLYAALRPRTIREQVVRAAVYLGLGIPSFWIGVFLLDWSERVAFRFSGPSDVISASALPFLYEWVAPVVLVTMTLVAAITSYARSQSLQYVNKDAARLVRAKGGGTIDVTRHV